MQPSDRKRTTLQRLNQQFLISKNEAKSVTENSNSVLSQPTPAPVVPTGRQLGSQPFADTRKMASGANDSCVLVRRKSSVNANSFQESSRMTAASLIAGPPVEARSMLIGSRKDREVSELDQLSQAFSRKATMAAGSSLSRPRHGSNSDENVSRRRSAAASHFDNERYLNDFDKGFQELKSLHVSQPFGMSDSVVPVRKTSQTAGGQGTVNPFLDNMYRTSDSNLAQAWYTGPRNPRGSQFVASQQPLLCMSVLDGEGVVGSSDHALYSFDIITGRRRRQLYSQRYGHREWVTCVQYLADGRIVSGGMDSKLCLWGSSGVQCFDLVGHVGSISSVKVNATGSLIVSGSYDKTIRVWDSHRRNETMCLKGHKGPVLDFAWAGGRLVSGARDGVAILWDLSSGALSRKLPGHRGHVTVVTAYEADRQASNASSGVAGGDSNIFLTGAQDGHIRVWDVRSSASGGAEFDLPLHAAAGNGDGVETGSSGGSAGALVAIECAQSSASAGEENRSLATSVIVTAGADKAINVLEPRMSFKSRVRFTDHSDFIYSLRIAGCLALSGAGDGMLMVHDLVEGRLLYGLGANRAAVRCVSTSGDLLIAAGDDGSAITYDFS